MRSICHTSVVTSALTFNLLNSPTAQTRVILVGRRDQKGKEKGDRRREMKHKCSAKCSKFPHLQHQPRESSRGCLPLEFLYPWDTVITNPLLVSQQTLTCVSQNCLRLFSVPSEDKLSWQASNDINRPVIQGGSLPTSRLFKMFRLCLDTGCWRKVCCKTHLDKLSETVQRLSP